MGEEIVKVVPVAAALPHLNEPQRAFAVACRQFRADQVERVETGREEETYGTLNAAVNHPGGPLHLQCFERAADADILQSNLTAIQLSGLN